MSLPANSDILLEEHVDALAHSQSETTRLRYISAHPELKQREVVKGLAEIVVRRLRADTQEALRLADAAIEIAQTINDQQSRALGLRAKANALYAMGENRAAVEHHEQAIAIFESLEQWHEAARTRSGSIQPLILVGEYDRAFAAAERAREVFTREALSWRLARLEINVGNIYHRQDRFEEALASYERAYEGLLAQQDSEGLGVVLSNMAVCLISLNDFPRALASYERARAVCEQSGMPLLVAQADYNIAYLYYLRGEYSQAIERLYAARKSCEAIGDHYHHALCHLDLSEIYVELNLSEEARAMAREGFQGFEKLGMRYEAAKTIANEAIALGQQGKTIQALERFSQAREMFAQEKNLVWPWLIDLYQALLLYREKRHFEARHLCAGAVDFFDRTALRGKAVLGHLLLARIAIEIGELDLARQETEVALGRLQQLQTPVLTQQAWFLSGQIAEARGESAAAYVVYQEARKSLESLRHRLQHEELKISFMKDRLNVYEALVDLCLRIKAAAEAAAEIFGYMEAAKSRSMAEMVLPSGRSLPERDSGQSKLVRRIRDLREELNWYYHRIELEQLHSEKHSRGRIEDLQAQVQAHENELLRALRELPPDQRESAALEEPAPVSLEDAQSKLPADTTLVEFFFSGEKILASVITRRSIEIVPVTLLSRVTHTLQLLQFQLGKFRLGQEYVRRFAEPLLGATLIHLKTLYEELLGPLESQLEGHHLLFVPHGPLHYLPFHALRQGENYLIDNFTVSYAPSATVFALCQDKVAYNADRSLVLGIPDKNAPEILAEVQSVAGLLPRPELFLGESATAAVLREKGPDCGQLHIASHGVYRQDNPMFSGIRLGDGYLNLYDLYHMKLGANLVTLSGCATGMNFVDAGDELMGLQRGLFRAGAATLMLSLWDVHDRTTADLMLHFYTSWTQTHNAAKSLQSAMGRIRESHPHPYFWAPFILIGKIAESTPLR